MAVTVRQFVESIVQSGLMTAAEVSAFEQGLSPRNRPQDAQSLARELVQAGKLTKYQAQLVYQGKTKGLVFGEYTVLDKLGQGGMGVVLKAQHRRMKRLVAIKVLPASAVKSAEAVKRFYREVEAAAKLTHPNIVTAYDASESDGIHYLVMEYVEGKDLASVVKERGPLEVKQALDCTLQAAKGLEYAHGEGIIHRDIKPGNLLLDKKGTVKILDMGLARVALAVGSDDPGAERLTQSGQVMGTCDYMAPEQAEDTRKADQRSDIYSLGCTLYRLLTGKVPYGGDSLVQILLAHQNAPVPSLRGARPDVPESVEAIFQKMMAKRPDERYQSMGEVIVDVEAFLGSTRRPPAAGPAPEPLDEVLPQSLAFLQHAAPLGTTTKQRKGTVAEDTLRRAAREETGTGIVAKVKRAVASARQMPLTMVWVTGGTAALVLVVGLVFVIAGKGRSTLPLPSGEGLGGGKSDVHQPSDSHPAPMLDQAAPRWLGYDLGDEELPRVLSEVAPYTNLAIVRGWGKMGPEDALFGEARRHGVKVVLGVPPKSIQEYSTHGLDLWKANRDVVIGGMLIHPDASFDLAAWGRKLKQAAADAQLWLIRGKSESDSPVPEEVDVLVPCLYGFDSPTKVQEFSEKGLPEHLKRVEGRRTVLAWNSWQSSHSGVVPECQAGTFRAVAHAVQENKLAGAFFVSYGRFGNCIGIQSRPELVAEIKEIAGEWRIAPGATAGSSGNDDEKGPHPSPLPKGEGTKPAPAVAPFDAATASRHQEAWARYLGMPVEMTNSIGMKLVLIPPGEFEMGCDEEELQRLLADARALTPETAAKGAPFEKSHFESSLQKYLDIVPSEGPRHHVAITHPFYLGLTEVTQAEYERVMGTNPSHFKVQPAGIRPVEQVPFGEAEEFCRRLSELPGEKGDSSGYRLPTEAEWEYACRAGTTTKYYFGPDGSLIEEYGFVRTNSGGTTQPVAQKKPNPWGLFDMLGNVSEWCSDWHFPDYYRQSPKADPTGPENGSSRVIRGGSWVGASIAHRSAHREMRLPTARDSVVGFRVMRNFKSSPQPPSAAASSGPPPSPPAPPIAPFDAATARKHQEAWAKYLGVPVATDNSIGMKLVLIPPGEFMMGSSQEEIDHFLKEAKDHNDSPLYIDPILGEGPRHRVRVTKPYCLAAHEVTVGQFRQFAEDAHFKSDAEKDGQGAFGRGPADNRFVQKPEFTWRSPGFVQNEDQPVVAVSWNDAVAFCEWLSRKEGKTYRLPSEAEWEYACRAGSTAKYYFGDEAKELDDHAWHKGNSQGSAHPVGQKRPNAWGLYDIYGNAWEWCADWHDPAYYAQSPSDDPTGPSSGSARMFRGGGWASPDYQTRSAYRCFGLTPSLRYTVVGFRVARTL